jgi:argininosuccinate lyase
MTDNKKTEVDAETLLLTLDQVSQTIDIMTDVVGKLRNYVTTQAQQSETNHTTNHSKHAVLVKGSHTLH